MFFLNLIRRHDRAYFADSKTGLKNKLSIIGNSDSITPFLTENANPAVDIFYLGSPIGEIALNEGVFCLSTR